MIAAQVSEPCRGWNARCFRRVRVRRYRAAAVEVLEAEAADKPTPRGEGNSIATVSRARGICREGAVVPHALNWG